MSIHRIVANIGFAADEPPGERRPAKIANLVEWTLPVNGFGLFSPKTVAIG